MATTRAGPRLQVGSTQWIAEERSSAAQVVQAETEEFSFSARNEVEWLNEHMADIFSKNQVNVAEIFKTPGKLRGKTPRTTRKANPLEARAPLSDIFSTTPRGTGLSPTRQAHFQLPIPSFRVAEDAPTPIEATAVPQARAESPLMQKTVVNNFDSGYFGSQYASQYSQSTHVNTQIEEYRSPKIATPRIVAEPEVHHEQEARSAGAEGRRNTEESFHSAKEEQTRNLGKLLGTSQALASPRLKESTRLILESPSQNRIQTASPQKRSPQRTAMTSSPGKALPSDPVQALVNEETVEDEVLDDLQSHSEGSSPLRPIVRKSSLNFASLPAREPITTKKSAENRESRTSHLEHNRTSYYGRQTGGKSLGASKQDQSHEEDDDEDIDDDMALDASEPIDSVSRLHNKTSTQRLQDQISMLGKAQPAPPRPSKSFAGSAIATSQTQHSTQGPSNPEVPIPKSPQKSPVRSPQRKPFAAPGAFPEDEDDSWIGPSTAAPVASVFSPRLGMTKSYSTDVMEEIHGKASIGGSEFNLPKRGESPRHRSPLREPIIPERSTSTLRHMKSASATVLRSPRKAGESPSHQKAISVSNPNPSIMEEDDMTPPPKSPSKSYKGSPLKAAKDKFSSILKTSRGLFASSAAISADAKTSAMSPAVNRSVPSSQPTFEDALQGHPYPTHESQSPILHTERALDSPAKASVRKTRASTEREERRREEETREAKQAKEAKEAQKMADQLEKARQKVKEDARVYHLEQEKVAAMQKQISALKEQDNSAKTSQVNVPKATRSSPRKTKAQLEAEGAAAAAASTDELSSRDVEMSDASAMPPPAIPRPKSQIGRPAAKRPLKPGKDAAGKAKPPTVIRVDTGSQRGHVGHQYHPSTSTLAATLQESLAVPSTATSSQSLRHKASTSSIASNASKGNSFKSAASKALEAAARKKEQDELAARRKKEAKEENDRQRAALKEEERRKEEQQRRQEMERQRAIQKEKEQVAQQLDAKKSASRQAIEKRRLEMEKAKQTGAPPPALRPQPSGDLDKPLPSVPRADVVQSSRVLPNQGSQRSQEDSSRPTLLNSAKIPPKRPLQHENGEEHHSRPTIQRNVPSYQQNEVHSKRRKTGETIDDDDDDEMSEPRPRMTAPPIRQSSSRPKESQPKSLFPVGYTNAPAPNNLQRAAIIQHHNMNQSKPTHPMDMAQISKARIPFASSTSQENAQHKTPARPATGLASKSAKSAARSSPRYQNGENIELPEINTDSEDEDDEDEPKYPVQPWTDSPEIRKAITRQEALDPADVFGQPGPLNMEEVFAKSKDRFHKFRQRTSSANWSGQDRLTEDEIRKDLEGRDKVRRQGFWTYDSMV